MKLSTRSQMRRLLVGYQHNKADKVQNVFTTIFNKHLEYSGISNKDLNVILMLFLLIELFVLLITSLNFYWIYFLPVPVLFLLIIFKHKIFERAQSFEKDYTVFLLCLCTSVRSGLDLLSAMYKSIDLFDESSIVKKELVDFKNNTQKGVLEEEAIDRFGSSIKHPDIELFRVAYMISRKQGSSVSKCLERLVSFTRDRQSVRRKIQTALIMQKISAYGIAFCATLILALQFIVNREAVVLCWEHAYGHYFLISGMFLVLAGVALMTRFSRLKI